MQIVGIGGGTGLPVLLRGLRWVADAPNAPKEGIFTTAVVCVSDNGGSSGALRESLGIPAVGDLRNCLVALARGNATLAEVFQHRLPQQDGLAGHCVGNLIVTALLERSGSIREAVRQAGEMLSLTARVLPSTEASATLCALFDDGSVVRGEAQLARRRKKIKRVWLEPEEPSPTPGLIDAIHAADAIVLGPGSMYTSIVPNLLARGVAQAIRRSPARKIFICNLMTQTGETESHTAADHLDVIEKYLGPGTINICVMNSGAMNPQLRTRYALEGARPVENNCDQVIRRGVVPLRLNLVEDNPTQIRHDSVKLANLVVALTRNARHTAWGRELCAAS